MIMMTVTDTLGRPLRDLRISVTDRCNFRCVHCMPREVFGRDYEFLERAELLTFEEIERLAQEIDRLARILVGDHGVTKLRLTGGEPLVSRELERLVETLARIPGLGDLAMTTNGSALARRARALRDAGLRRITVSLDGLDNEVFVALNDVGFAVDPVLAGIEAAAAAGLGPIKINMVVKRGVNEDGVLPMARHFRGSGQVVRFIEYMDVGHSNGWRMDDVVPAAEIVAMIGAELPLEPVAPNYPGEVVERWRYRDGSGEIGVIGSVTRPFCGGCTRARLSADGKLFTCSPSRATTCGRRCAAAPPTPRFPPPSAPSGGRGATATRSCARPRPRRCRRWRCPTSADSRPPRHGRSSGRCQQPGRALLPIWGRDDLRRVPAAHAVSDPPRSLDGGLNREQVAGVGAPPGLARQLWRGRATLGPRQPRARCRSETAPMRRPRPSATARRWPARGGQPIGRVSASERGAAPEAAGRVALAG
jgi:cyclic pyranopterin phosphate synthase